MASAIVAYGCGEPRRPAATDVARAPRAAAPLADADAAADAGAFEEEDDGSADAPSPAGGRVERVIVESSAQIALSSKLVADGTHLYWYAAGRGIQRLSQAGGTPELVAPSSTEHESLHALAANRAALGWATDEPLAPGNGSVHVLRAGTTITVAKQEPFPLAVALDSRHVYWSTMEGKAASAPSGIGPSGVRRARLAGGAPAEMLAAGRDGATELALDRTHVYFFHHRSTGNADVVRAPKKGGDVTVLASNQDSPTGLAVDASHVYFAIAGPLEMPRALPCKRPPCPVATAAPIYRDGELRRVPTSGGRIETLATKLKNARELGLSSDAVYYRDQDGWRVVPKAGGTPKPMIEESTLPRDVRVMAIAYVANERKIFVIVRRP